MAARNLASNRIRPAGLSNYANLIEDPKVATSLANTLFYAVLAVPLEVAFALCLALLLNQVGRGAGAFRTIYYLPQMTPAVHSRSAGADRLLATQGSPRTNAVICRLALACGDISARIGRTNRLPQRGWP